MFAMGDYVCLLSFISLRHNFNFVDLVVPFDNFRCNYHLIEFFSFRMTSNWLNEILKKTKLSAVS